MTEPTEFREALEAFRAMPYPDYPRQADLQEWNSLLLDLDGHIAGYAVQVGSGRMKASEVPDLDSLVLKVESLRRGLGEIRSEQQEDADLLDDYRIYAAAFERLVQELASLARRQGEQLTP